MNEPRTINDGISGESEDDVPLAYLVPPAKKCRTLLEPLLSLEEVEMNSPQQVARTPNEAQHLHIESQVESDLNDMTNTTMLSLDFPSDSDDDIILSALISGQAADVVDVSFSDLLLPPSVENSYPNLPQSRLSGNNATDVSKTEGMHDTNNAGPSAVDGGNDAGQSAVDGGNDAGTSAADGGNDAGPNAADGGNDAGPSAADGGRDAGTSAADGGNDARPSAADGENDVSDDHGALNSNSDGIESSGEEFKLPYNHGYSAEESSSDSSPERNLSKKRRIRKQRQKSGTFEEQNASSQIETDNKNENPRQSRKKTRDPENWKANIRKRKRNHGEEYTNSKGKRVPMRECQSVQCSCKHHCQEFTDEDRQHIFTSYWKLVYDRQRDFLKRHIKCVDKRRCTKRESPSRRLKTYEYYLPSKGSFIQVCRTFFLGTLNIGEKTVYYTLQNRTQIHSTDGRGRQFPHNKLSEDQKKSVREHISSFPKVDSHYCRATTTRQYLSKDLSVAKMYRLYTKQCQEQKTEPVKQHVYNNIFRTEFNLGFHIPKKDACALCVSFEGMSTEEKRENQEKLDRHLKRKSEARELKSIDKAKALGDENYNVINFDLQKVLITPKSNASDFYYSRKLATYNLSVYNMASRHVNCYMWDESQGKRGSCEIASCIYDYNKSIGSVQDIVYYSDSCTGQQRNIQFAAMCLYSVSNLPIQRITHNYFERGHSQMEGDSVHATIERSTKHAQLYTPSEWMVAVRNAKQKPPYYEVKELNRIGIYNFKQLVDSVITNRSKATDGTNVEWIKIHSFQYRKDSPGFVYYKYGFDEDYKQLNAQKQNPRASTGSKVKDLQNHPLRLLYSGQLPISEAKYKDLNNLCTKGLIPQNCHSFYRNLSHTGNQKERLPEPNESDASDIEA